MLRDIKLYLRYSGQNIRGLMEYKNDFIVSTVAGAVWQCVGLVFLFALFHNIHDVGGWTLYEVALLYGCVMFSEGLVTFGCQGASTGLARKIKNGEFDRLMVRPVHLMTQMMGGQINFAGLCTMVTSIAVLVVSIQKLHVTVSFGLVLLFAFNLLLGGWIRINLDVAVQCISFLTLSGGGLGSMVRSTQNFGRYPITIFPKFIQYMLFSIFPHGMVSYIPVCLLLGKMPVWPYALAVPASAVFMTGLRMLIFRMTVKRYESAGT